MLLPKEIVNILVFGAGTIYQKVSQDIPSNDVVAIVDNNNKLWGKRLDGKVIIPPNEIQRVEYDYIIIAISISYYREIRNQLIELGVLQDKIIPYNELGKIYVEDNEYSFVGNGRTNENGNVLLVTYNLNNNGAGRALLELGLAVSRMGLKVDVLSEKDGPQRIEYVNYGINVYCNQKVWWNSNLYLGKCAVYQLIIVNTLQLYQKVLLLNNSEIEIWWWLHEPSFFYANRVDISELDGLCFRNVNIYAVSDKAKGNWINYTGYDEIGVLPACIKDCNFSTLESNITSERPINLVVIGGLSDNKNQIELLKALSLLTVEEKNEYFVRLIGEDSGNFYSKKVHEFANRLGNVFFCGEKSHKEIYHMYENGEIDVLVCTSKEETFSLASLEAMMFERFPLVSSGTGIAKYIDNQISGLIYKSGNIDDLADKLRWLIKHKNEYSDVCKKARNVYLNHFSTDSMTMFLKRELRRIIN